MARAQSESAVEEAPRERIATITVEEAALPAIVDVRATSRPAAPSTQRPIGALAGGIAMLVGGYVGAAVWGGYFFADRQLGVLGCNDTYAGWHFLPLAGPVIGMVAGGECVPDSLHFEEAVVPVVLSGLQLAGVVLAVVGAVLHSRERAPVVTVSVDPTSALVLVSGAF